MTDNTVTSSSAGLAALSQYVSDASESEDDNDQCVMDTDVNIAHVSQCCRASVKRTYSSSQQIAADHSLKRRHTAGQPCHAVMPLPHALHEMFRESTATASSPPPQDDPASHDGKLRCFPHERGNWSSCVLVPLSDRGPSLLPSVVAACVAVCQSSLAPSSDSGEKLPVMMAMNSEQFHVSLSRTLVLRHHWIDQLTVALRRAMRPLPAFRLFLGAPRIYINDSLTRTFLGLTVSSSGGHGASHLATLTAAVDSQLATFGLPAFYQEASYHVSIAWCVGDQRQQLTRLLPRLGETVTQFNSLEPLSCLVSRLIFKCGHLQFHLPLDCSTTSFASSSL